MCLLVCLGAVYFHLMRCAVGGWFHTIHSLRTCSSCGLILHDSIGVPGILHLGIPRTFECLVASTGLRVAIQRSVSRPAGP